VREDLPRYMAERGLDALVVVGPGHHNPPMVYLLGQPTDLTDAVLIYPREGTPVLLHSPMERDAIASLEGITPRSFEHYPLRRYTRRLGDPWEARVARWVDILHDAGLDRATFAVLGRVEFGHAWSLWRAIQDRLPQARVLGREGVAALSRARIRKARDEVEAIRQVGRKTLAVVRRTEAWLRELAQTEDGRIVDADGAEVTIGQVKRRIRLWVAEAELELPYGFIFAQGRDAGVPHNPGDEDAVLRAGVPIVFDIFPQEAGGGYFYDFTRTWVLGRAPEAVKHLHQQVLRAFQAGLAHVRAGVPAEVSYRRACEVLEGHGHPTQRTRPGAQLGFVHTLGHGLGLEIHEPPRLASGETAPLEPGMVVTVEPGLYYPEKGMGVRIEDTVWIRDDGEPEILVPYPYDLEIPLAVRGGG